MTMTTGAPCFLFQASWRRTDSDEWHHHAATADTPHGAVKAWLRDIHAAGAPLPEQWLEDSAKLDGWLNEMYSLDRIRVATEKR